MITTTYLPQARGGVEIIEWIYIIICYIII